MRMKFYCEFCGQEFVSADLCAEHERSHGSLYIDHESIRDNGISHSGNRAGSAPALIYIPVYHEGKECTEKLYCRYIFTCEVDENTYEVLKEEGEIVDD